VKVVKPEHCTVAETLVTNPLKKRAQHAQVQNGLVNKVFDRFEPAGTNFLTLGIGSQPGFTCAIAGNRILKGFVYGESVESGNRGKADNDAGHGDRRPVTHILAGDR
jgi:hypothetical protein